MAPAVETATQTGMGAASGGGSSAQNGARTAPVAMPDLAQAVTQSGGTERSAVALAEDSYIAENSRARLEAAQRAYVAAVRAAGLNPLAHRAP